jgi:membrane-bound lytic murein transglycosylase D
MRILLGLLSCCCFFTLFSQENTVGPSVDNEDSLVFQRFMETMEESLKLYRDEWIQEENYDSIVNILGYNSGEIPVFSDSAYCQHLQMMNESSPYPFDCEPSVLKTIEFFTKNRRSFIQVALSRSRLYFDLFESTLDHYNLPLELKYLAVIESGLRPQVKSRAGAMGLWQFMYPTGKMYGLKQDSYIDERMDPVKATDAACRYLKRLHEMYNDWNMALAAYNAGPGNVNKAIRRSGGKMTYWEIRPYLPRETQGYVPNFIAAAYLMSNHTLHNIIPAPAQASPHELDTVCLKTGIQMRTLEIKLDWSLQEIHFLNPIYKSNYIPNTDPKQCILMPLSKVSVFIDLGDSLYYADSLLFHPTKLKTTSSTITTPQIKVSEPTIQTSYHKVKKGETLGLIASKYGTTVNQLMKLNNLRSTNLQIDQTLRIESGAESTRKEQVVEPIKKTGDTKYHTVKSGDTFWKIAQQYGTTVDVIQKLNPSSKSSELKLGQKIRVQ